MLAADTSKAAGPPGNPVAIERAQADADYAFQGEYSGQLDGGKAGVQIVALGAGKFDAVLYPGGLPGDGWTGDKTRLSRGTAVLAGASATLTLTGKTGTIGGGKLTLGSDVLQRIERTSPTMGAKPPEGAVVLFNGSNTEAWDGSGMDAGKLLKEGQTTKQKFQNYSLHLEFLLAYKPAARGQDRGNSGFTTKAAMKFRYWTPSDSKAATTNAEGSTP